MTAIIFLGVMIAIIIGVPLYIGWKANRPIHVPDRAYNDIAKQVWGHMAKHQSGIDTMEFASIFDYNGMAIELLCELHISYDIIREFGGDGESWENIRLEYCDLIFWKVTDPDGYEMNSDFDPEELFFQIINY